MEDMNGAVTANKSAVDITPNGHPNRAMCLSNLRKALQECFDRTNAMIEAIVTKKETFETITPIEQYLKTTTSADLNNDESNGRVQCII